MRRRRRPVADRSNRRPEEVQRGGFANEGRSATSSATSTRGLVSRWIFDEVALVRFWEKVGANETKECAYANIAAMGQVCCVEAKSQAEIRGAGADVMMPAIW
jgi:hypothetical protein